MTTHMERHGERRPAKSRRRRRMHTRVKRHSEALAQGREYLAGEGREKRGVGQTDELKSSGLRRRFGTIYRTEARVVVFSAQNRFTPSGTHDISPIYPPNVSSPSDHVNPERSSKPSTDTFHYAFYSDFTLRSALYIIT